MGAAAGGGGGGAQDSCSWRRKCGRRGGHASEEHCQLAYCSFGHLLKLNPPESGPKIGIFGHWGFFMFQVSFADFGGSRKRLRNEDVGARQRRSKWIDAAPRDGLGDQTSPGELLRRICRQNRGRRKAGPPERACGADLGCCALEGSSQPRMESVGGSVRDRVTRETAGIPLTCARPTSLGAHTCPVSERRADRRRVAGASSDAPVDPSTSAWARRSPGRGRWRAGERVRRRR